MKLNFIQLENFKVAYPLEHIVDPKEALFFDIETTGFTAKSSHLYLIGCAFYTEGSWYLRQWFAENYNEEEELLTSFFTFAATYKYLVHFNGNNFDIPYLEQKCEQLGLPFNFKNFEGIDLYKRVAPYKYFLKLPNCKQKTIEQFLGIDRADVFTGGELIGVYHDYVKAPSDYHEKSLLLHNEDDLKGMLNILPILAYYDLFQNQVIARKVQANSYKDMQGNKRQELIMTLELVNALPKEISYYGNGCYFKANGNEAQLRVPIYEEELKYFYSNHKDYYYLPTEDVALHKSVAAFVEKEHRVQATASTCYTRKHSTYLPQWEIIMEPFFKREHKSKELFFELTDEIKQDRSAFTKYANHILSVLASTY